MSTAAQNRIWTSALDYAELGWRIVPIRARAKLPAIAAWQKKASCDPGVIGAWFSSNPDWNLGVKLGAESNLIDVECDNEQAEQQLLAIFGGDIPLAPSYRASRGLHRFFKHRSDLPGGAVIHLGAIEIRTGGGGKGAQSVLPPSIHPTGVEYTWVVEMPTGRFPDALWAACWNQAGDDLTPPAEYRTGEKSPAERAALYIDRIEGAVEGARNQTCYRVSCVLLRDFDLAISEAACILGGFNQRCKPPLPAREVATCLENARKHGMGPIGSKLTTRKAANPPHTLQEHAAEMWAEQVQLSGTTSLDDEDTQAKLHRRLAAMAQPMVNEAEIMQICDDARGAVRTEAQGERAKLGSSLTALGLERRAGEWWPGLWKVEVCNSDPRIARLHAPFLPDGYISMTLEAFNDYADVHLAVLCATGTVCLDDRPGFWSGIWNGQRGNKKEGIPSAIGLKAKLLRDAVWIEAPPESQRSIVIAEMVLEKLENAKPVKDDADPGFGGMPSLMPDGNVLFIFGNIWEPMRRTDDRIERMELSRVLQSCAITDKAVRLRATGKVTRMKVASPDAISKLREMCKIGLP